MLPAGKGEEQALAGTVLTLLCLQMGSGSEGEEVFRSLKPLLVSVLTDSMASPGARQSVRPSPFPPSRGGYISSGESPGDAFGGPPCSHGSMAGLGAVGTSDIKQGHPNPASRWLGAQFGLVLPPLTAFSPCFSPVCHSAGHVLLHCSC